MQPGLFSTKSSKSRVSWSVFACFCNVFLQNTEIYTFVAIKPFQNSCLQCFQFPLSPQTLENAAIYTVFFNFSMLVNSNIYTKNPSKTLFCQCFYNVFSWRHRNLHVFRHKVGPKHWFLQCALASKNHSKYRYLQRFFISVRFSLAGSRPKWPKIPFRWPLKLRHPKIVEKRADTTLLRSRCEIPGLGAKSFLPAPPPAKADIATAILTNWMLLSFSIAVCTPISTPSPPKRCGRIFLSVVSLPNDQHDFAYSTFGALHLFY